MQFNIFVGKTDCSEHFNHFFEHSCWVHEPFGTGHEDISIGLEVIRNGINMILEENRLLRIQRDKAYKDLMSKDKVYLETLIEERVEERLNEIIIGDK
jgi:hypothetical protein